MAGNHDTQTRDTPEMHETGFRHAAGLVRIARVVRVVWFVSLVMPAAAEAQDVLSRFELQLEGAYLVSDDPRFNWVFDFGAELDAVDWGGGRATFAAGYEAIAGQEFRRFDVNQGNYLLEGILAFRAGAFEIGPVWHHVSRHLSDRPKRFPIDWNMIALRAAGRPRAGGLALAWHADARRTVTRAFVDYDWELEAAASAVGRLGGRWSAAAAASLRAVGVDGSRERGAQWGGRVEGGVRLGGRVAAGELFVAVERRVDPYPAEFGTARWLTAGLRLRPR